MAKGNILKEAIADAKAVREVALANAKSALEEAFTPKLQNMLSARLQEDLEEDYYEEDDQDLELGEMDGIEGNESEDSMDEEIDLEDILNELELEGDADDEEVVEGKKTDDDEEDLEEIHRVGQPNYKADGVHDVLNRASDVNDNLAEDKEFDLDALLKEINDLDEQAPTPQVRRNTRATPKRGAHLHSKHRPVRSVAHKAHKQNKKSMQRANRNSLSVPKKRGAGAGHNMNPNPMMERGCKSAERELKELKKVLNVKTAELNEVNLLNSKLLYVNRIFKANQLDDSQKLRVVETLDKADSTKEAKLIYETIKDTFKVANTKKESKKTITKKTIKESFRGMASKAAGTSRVKKTAPKRAVISESDNMVNRFQKLANIKINE